MKIDYTSGLLEYVIFIIFIIGGIYLLFFKLTFVTIIVGISYLIAETSYPVGKFFMRFGIPIWASGFFAVALFVVVIGLFIIYTIPPLVNQLVELEKQMPFLIDHIHQYINDVYLYVGEHLGYKGSLDYFINSIVNPIKSHLASFAVTSALGVIKGASAAVAFVLIPLIAYLMIIYKVDYQNSVRKIILNILGEDYLTVFSGIHNVILGYIKGLMILMVIVFLLTFVGFYLVGIKYTLLFAVFSGISYIIPYVGAFLSMIPPIIVALVVHKSLIMAVEITVVFLIIHFICGNVIAPFVYSKQLKINALAVLLAILFFGELLGIGGVILSVPLLGILMISYDKLAPILSERRES